MNDDCKTVSLTVEIQENGIIRDLFGWVIGRANEDWRDLMFKHEGEPVGLFIHNGVLNYRGCNYVPQSWYQRLRQSTDIGDDIATS